MALLTYLHNHRRHFGEFDFGCGSGTARVAGRSGSMTHGGSAASVPTAPGAAEHRRTRWLRCCPASSVWSGQRQPKFPIVVVTSFLSSLVSLLLAVPERSPEGAKRRACQQQRMPTFAYCPG